MATVVQSALQRLTEHLYQIRAYFILNEGLLVEEIIGSFFNDLKVTWRNLYTPPMLPEGTFWIRRNQRSNLMVICLFLGFIIWCLILTVTCSSKRNNHRLFQWQWFDGKCDCSYHSVWKTNCECLISVQKKEKNKYKVIKKLEGARMKS